MCFLTGVEYGNVAVSGFEQGWNMIALLSMVLNRGGIINGQN